MTLERAELERLTGHRFDDPELLERAATHRSWAYEKLPSGSDDEVRELHNESLEFVGDAVLGLVIAEDLFRRHPGFTEGELTLMKHHLVSTESLAGVAGRLDLGQHLRIGRGEERSGGRRKQAMLANLLEAVIGAIFFDGGYGAARDFVTRIFAEDLRRSTPENSVDFKSRLQETLQARKLPVPKYRVLESHGPAHERTFVVEASWRDGTVTAHGPSIKAAEMKAAQKILDRLENATEAAGEVKKNAG
jgi:ribonuclease-3